MPTIDPPEGRTPPPPAMPEAGHRSWACLNRGVEVSHISSNSRYTCWAQAVWLRQARAIRGR